MEARRTREGSMQAIQAEPVRSLWVGEELPAAHAACIASYLRVGHPFELFTYGPVRNVPRGVRVRDAGAIVGKDRIFRYGSAAKESKGGLSGFSNLFRYALLAREGGYWVDCDVFCLRRMPTDEVVISTERMKNGRRTVTSCVLKCPAGHAMAHYCLARAIASDPATMVHGETGPALVAEFVRKRGLERALTEPDAFCCVDWFDAGALLRSGTIPASACGVHLWGEVWRREGGVPWPGPEGSIMHDLARRSEPEVLERRGWWRALRGLARPAAALNAG